MPPRSSLASRVDHVVQERPVHLVLQPRPPFRLDLTVWALRRRRRNRVDRWDGRYRRALLVGDRALTVQVEQVGDRDHPTLAVTVLTPGTIAPGDLASIEIQLTRLLALDVDLDRFYELADADPLIGPLKELLLGVRPPRFPTLYEAFVNAIANQQLSLEVGIELLNRFTERFGTRPSDDHGLFAFPDPRSVLDVPHQELRSLGFSLRKADYLLNCASLLASGGLDTTRLESTDRTDATRLLVGIHGIGRWSAEYVLLRGLGRLDVFPADDVGARNKLERFMGLAHPPSRDEIVALLERWRPCAGMVYFHLLLDGLVERGDLDV